MRGMQGLNSNHARYAQSDAVWQMATPLAMWSSMTRGGGEAPLFKADTKRGKKKKNAGPAQVSHRTWDPLQYWYELFSNIPNRPLPIHRYSLRWASELAGYLDSILKTP